MAPLFKKEKYSTLEHVIKWGAKYWHSSAHTAEEIYRNVSVSVRCYEQFFTPKQGLEKVLSTCSQPSALAQVVNIFLLIIQYSTHQTPSI
jgi:hypothetical protein